jgi:hypothetical protein
MTVFEYKICGSHINHADTVLGVFLDSKFYFHQLVDYTLLQALKLLDIIHTINFSSIFRQSSDVIFYISYI